MTTNEILLLAWAREALASGTAKTIRVRRGLSQADVASSVRVRPNAVSRWESGQRTPRGEAGLRYAKLLQRLAAGSRR